MGSLRNIDFGVFWASWGGSGKEPGSGNRRWFHSMGSGFLRFWSSGNGFLMVSDGFGDFGFRWGPKGSGTKSCRRHVGPSSCHLGVVICVKRDCYTSLLLGIIPTLIVIFWFLIKNS